MRTTYASPRAWAVAPLLTLVVAFVAFSLVASAVYVANDLLDLAADRAHPSKQRRPFASGALPIASGVLAIPLLLGLASALAIWGLPPAFLAVLDGYTLADLVKPRKPLARLLDLDAALPA